MMDKKFAVIDLGSNSLRLLIARVEKNTILPERRELRETRLGQGLKPGGVFYPEARERTLAALQELFAVAREAGVTDGLVVATSAVREAADGHHFLDELGRWSPFPPRLLTPLEEARLGFNGALQALDVKNGLVVDLGGRSTEISWLGQGEEKDLISFSLPIGAVRLHEAFQSGPEPQDLAYDRLQAHVHALLGREMAQNPFAVSAAETGTAPLDLIGLGGTITTLAALDCGLTEYDPLRVHGHCLTRKAVTRWLKTLLRCSLEELKGLLSFAPKRADIFPAGLAAWLAMMDFWGLDHCTVSEEGLLWGVLQELAGGAAGQGKPETRAD